MSSHQLDELNERRFVEKVAAALGISVDELDDAEWSAEPVSGDDGIIYSYCVTYGNGQSKNVYLPEE